VIVVPPATARQVLAKAAARLACEGEKHANPASGVVGLDVYNMRKPLQKTGLRYVD